MRFTTGLPRLDDELGGGVASGAVTLVYGEEKSGKTSLVLRICALATRKSSSAYVDCSGRLHPVRLTQILEANRADTTKLYLLSVNSFQRQEDVILSLYDLTPPAPLIVFDDFTALHRLELTGNVKEDMNIYKRLAFQIAALKEAAMEKDLAIIIVGQVHAIPDSGDSRVVAQRILGHWSDYILRLERRPGKEVGRIFVEKPEGRGFVSFRISGAGVVPE